MDADAAKNHASQALVKGLTGIALSAAGRAVQLDLNDVGALVLLGMAQIAAGQAAYALAPLLRAVALCPTRPEVHFGLGSALQSLGRFGEATEAMRTAAKAAAASTELASAFVERVL